jgi:Glycosyl hydrolase family 26
MRRSTSDHLVGRRRAVATPLASAILGLALSATPSPPLPTELMGAGRPSVGPSDVLPGPPQLGLYAGPGPRTADAVPPFADWAGLPVRDVLDFPPDATWTGHTGLTGPGWLLGAHRGRAQRLEYSLPMFPDQPGYSLAECAAGAYDEYWALTGRRLVDHELAGAVVRPGWEFNARWYRWSAIGRADDYVGCFRAVVTAMRAVPGNRFTFDWNPNAGSSPFPAEQAYPGDDYVDYVGVDVYDTSWTWYPTPAGTSTAIARERAWRWLLLGDHGLTFWRNFAAAHGKPLTVPEWALTIRADGHGGGDNPLFVTNMLDFIADPANNVAYQHYFNIDGGSVQHDMTRPGSPFPAAADTFRDRTRRWSEDPVRWLTPPKRGPGRRRGPASAR